MTPEITKKIKRENRNCTKVVHSEIKLYDGDFEHTKSKKQIVLLKLSPSNYDLWRIIEETCVLDALNRTQNKLYS